MPRRRFGAAVRERADRLNVLFAQTITHHRLVLIPSPRRRGEPERMQLAFRVYSMLAPAPLATRFGSMGLYIGQLFEAGAAGVSGPPVVAVKYRYALHRHGTEEPLVRWEYDGTAARGTPWCRHHLQGPMRLPVTGEAIPLDDLHLPTGEVRVEDVIRFCIVDLGVEPFSSGWSDLLDRSHG